jgi:ABC-type nitrate/sulfonate/bicarbonate transport system substrate-binding protein
MMRTRRESIAGLAALGLAALPAMSRAQPHAPVDLTYGTLAASSSEWPILLAQEQGMFREAGLNVSVVYAGNPQNVINGVATGAMNFGDGGTDTLIAAIAHGIPMKLIAPLFSVSPYSLLVPESIKTFADLKGKTIMLGTKQDVSEIIFSRLAAQAGLAIGDFSVVIGGNSSTRYAALASGNAQGAILGQPFDFIAESKGMHVLGNANDAMKDWIFSSVATNPAWASANRPLVVAFLRALRRAMQFGYSHKAAAVAALVNATHAEPAIAAASYDLDFTKWRAFDASYRFTPASLRTLTTALVASGAIAESPSYAEVYDPSFAVEALLRD